MFGNECETKCPDGEIRMEEGEDCGAPLPKLPEQALDEAGSPPCPMPDDWCDFRDLENNEDCDTYDPSGAPKYTTATGKESK